jgi:hypothetical protein
MFDPKDYKTLVTLLKPGDLVRTNLDGSRVIEDQLTSGLVIDVSSTGVVRINRVLTPGSADAWKLSPLHVSDESKDKIILELVAPKELQDMTGKMMDLIMNSRMAVGMIKEYAKIA